MEKDKTMRAKEAMGILATALAYEQHEKTGLKIPPEDVGDGWKKIQLPSHPMYANAANFAKQIRDGYLNVMVEHRKKRDDPKIFPFGRWHLSISHNPLLPGRMVRMPTWEEMKDARYKFTPNGVNMAIMFPPDELYYNLHPTCLHLLEIPVCLALDPKKNGGI